MQKDLEEYYNKNKDKWTVNAIGLTGRYLNEGLVDRAITRNIEWGVRIPQESAMKNVQCTMNNECLDDWSSKRVYIWAENVLGYLSMAKEFCEKTGRDWREFLLDDNKVERLHYYVHAKDNIPFHALILPGLMHANPAESYHKPDLIVSSEYVNLEGKKMSKSAGTLITAEELCNNFNIDFIRFYFLRNVNDRKDFSFSFTDFVHTINGELINNFGNLINRTLSFAKSKLDGKVTHSDVAHGVTAEIAQTTTEVNALMVAGKTGAALKAIFNLVNFGNKYFDECKPWISVKENVELAQKNIFEVVTIIANAVRLAEPFVPTACQKVREWLGIEAGMDAFSFAESIELPELSILYQRLDLKEVTEKFSKYV
jgi:methionyl-tRNA synthetase